MGTDAVADARLHLSESPVASPHCRLAIEAELTAINRYPDPDCRALTTALARHWRLDSDNLAIGNGSDELILLCALALGSPPSPGVVTAGTFAGHRFALEVARRGVREVPLTDGRIDVQSFAEALDGAGIAFLCTPHNPSGAALSRNELAGIVDAARAARTTLIVDEAYMEFAPVATASVARAVQADANTVALRTFSKAYGLAGVRVGYAIANVSDAAALRHAQRVLPFRVNRLGQAAALAALEDVNCIERVRAETAKKRAWFTSALRDAGVTVRDSSTNFVAVQVADPAAVVRLLLQEFGIAVRDTTEMGYPGHVRISLGADEDLCRVIEALSA